jgi:GTP cyclohydrolase I
MRITQSEAISAIRNLCAFEGIRREDRIFGIPRGGVPVALAISGVTGCQIVSAVDADIIVDDIYDTGNTMARYAEQFPGKRYVALFDKRAKPWHGQWLVMPWEASEDHDGSGVDAVIRLLQYIGEDPTREGLRQTPDRVLRAWREWCSGYGADPAEVLTTFEDGAARVDELVVMRGIPVYSTCEHHLAPFFGTATIGYIPNGRIVGLSKLDRLTNIFAKRLQVQERLTNQIADALEENLEPLGVGVIITCRHMCMESRGVYTPGTPTTTSALRGALYDDARARAEFMALRT